MEFTDIEHLSKLEAEISNDIEYYRHSSCLFFFQEYNYNKIIKLTFQYETVAIKLLTFYAKKLKEESDTGAKIRGEEAYMSVNYLMKIQKLDKKRVEYENLGKYCAECINTIELF